MWVRQGDRGQDRVGSGVTAGSGTGDNQEEELVLELERSFGVSIGDEETGMKVLRSVDAIADYVTRERAKKTA